MADECYIMDTESRDVLAARFLPQYNTFAGLTIVTHGDKIEDPKIRVLGKVDNGDGLEALVCSINNVSTRDNGEVYYITWSFDEGKYGPSDAAELVKTKKYTISIPIDIGATITSL